MMRHALRMAWSVPPTSCSCAPSMSARLLAGDDLHHRPPALQLRHSAQERPARRRHHRRRHPRRAARRRHPHLTPASSWSSPSAPSSRLATYAVDYGWYSFFLTPTFVLLSLPYLRDWRLRRHPHGHHRARRGRRHPRHAPASGRRASRLETLPPARPLRRRGRRLRARRAPVLDHPPPPKESPPSANSSPPPAAPAASPARTPKRPLDRTLLEPGASLALSRRSAANSRLQTESALAFTTYVRRFTQCLTTLAAVGRPPPRPSPASPASSRASTPSPQPCSRRGRTQSTPL